MASTEPWISQGGVYLYLESLLATRPYAPPFTAPTTCRAAVTGIELAPLERLARSRTPAWHARATG
jgi:hypothetical protein